MNTTVNSIMLIMLEFEFYAFQECNGYSSYCENNDKECRYCLLKWHKPEGFAKYCIEKGYYPKSHQKLLEGIYLYISSSKYLKVEDTYNRYVPEENRIRAYVWKGIK